VPTPMNEEAVKIVKKLETGELVPDPENIVLFDEVLAKIG